MVHRKLVANFAVLALGCAPTNAPEPESPRETSSVPLAVASQLVTSSCVTLPADADSMLSNPPAHKNAGAMEILRVGGDDQSLLRFDLSGIPYTAVIERATLELVHLGSGGAEAVNTHRVTAPWSEATVTYASFAQAYEPAVAGSFVPRPKEERLAIDVTATTRSWVACDEPNYGFLLESASRKKTIFVSREGDTSARRPTLTLCYSQPEDGAQARGCPSNLAELKIELARTKAEIEATVATAETQATTIQQQVEAVSTEAATALATIEAERESATRSYSETVQARRAQFEETKAAAQQKIQDSQNSIAAARETYDTRSASLEETAAAEAAATEQSVRDRYASGEALDVAALQAMKAEKDQKLQALQAAIEAEQAFFESAVRAGEATILQERDRLEEARRALDADLEAMEQSYRARMDDLAQRAASTRDEAESEILAYQAEIERARAAAQAQVDELVRAMSEMVDAN